MASIIPQPQVQPKPPEASRRQSFGFPGKRRAIFSLSLLLLTLILYNPVVRNSFVTFDDPAYITANQHVHNGLTWTTVKWAFQSTEESNWHPLTWLSHALDWQLFGSHAAGHHYMNVLLHALCVVLLFLFFADVTGHLWRSAALAALFAVHPINVESVAWAAERKNVLCTVFFLLCLMAYRRYARNPGFKKYFVVAFWFALGLMSKPMVITLPFVLLLLDYWPLNRMELFGSSCALDSGIDAPKKRSFWVLLLEKVPLLALSVGSAIITIIAQRGVAIKTQYPFSERLQNAAVCYAEYLLKAIWPANLAVLYPHPMSALPVWQVALASCLLAIITVAVLLSLRRYPYLAVGWFWFLGTLVPVIGLVQVGEQAMADRYAYIPFLGLFFAVVWAVGDFVRSRKQWRFYAIPLALALIAALAVKARAQIGYWRSSATLWSHALDVTKNNFVAEDSMGAELIQQGKIAEAEAHFRAASVINPKDPFGWLDLGVCEKAQGNIPSAVKHFELALQLSTDSSLRSTALGNLASIYRMTGNYSQARKDYLAALALLPNNQFALTGLGLIAQRTGNFEQAIQYYTQAAQANPSDISYALLAQAFKQAGDNQQADAVSSQAHALSSNWERTQQMVKKLLSEQP